MRRRLIQPITSTLLALLPRDCALELSVSGRPESSARLINGPLRTCVGCKAKAAKVELLRVVAIDGILVPDPRGRRPGRGAHLHPRTGCLDLAERRRAFARALRLPGPLDISALRTWIEEHDTPSTTVSTPIVPTPGRAGTVDSEAGRNQR